MRNSVGEPYRRKKSWYFTYNDSGGKRRESKPYQTETGAKKAATALRNQMAAGAAAASAAASDEIRPWDGTLSWWCELLAVLGRKVAGGGTADQRNDLRAIAQASQAVKSLHDLVELEDRIRRLERLESEADLREQHAIGADVPPAEAGAEVGSK